MTASTTQRSGAREDGARSAGRLEALDIRLSGTWLRGRRRWIATFLLGLFVLAGSAYVILTAVRVHDHSAAAADSAAALPAAGTSVSQLLSYDSTNMAPTQQAVDQLTVGAFHDQFSGVFSQVVAPNAIAQRARSKADVRGSSVISAEVGKVVVLLLINQSTSSDQLAGDRVDTIEARVTMTKVDDRWLVSGLDQI